MGDQPLGANARAELQRRAKELSGKLDEIAELQEEVKQLKAEMKSEGYDLKAVAQIVKELRRGPEYQAGQLELELVLDTYRKAVAPPTDLEAAQAAAAEAAAEIPEPRRRKGRSLEDALADPALEGTSMAIGDGPFHEFGPARRKGKKGSMN